MKILASDFDNTIYMENDYEQTKKNIEAIRRFVSQGNIFCIITGRSYPNLKKSLIEEQIPYSYLICEDGAKIFNNMDYCINTTFLKKEEVEFILSILEQYPYNFYLEDGYSKTNNKEDCVKIVVDCSEEKSQEKIIKDIRKICEVHIYASRYHINIIHETVNKKNALYKLLELEKLDLNKLFVIGDNDNDYEMLKSFQGGVMKHHHPLLEELHKKEYNTLENYIEELMQN